ncbi:beta-grasp domain-containing protein [Tanacetum coccineum]
MQSPCSSDMHNTIDVIEDYSGSSNLCNGRTLACLNSIGSGSNGNNRHRAAQREDALNKFRMKRKDRCINKKHGVVAHLLYKEFDNKTLTKSSVIGSEIPSSIYLSNDIEDKSPTEDHVFKKYSSLKARHPVLRVEGNNLLAIVIARCCWIWADQSAESGAFLQLTNASVKYPTEWLWFRWNAWCLLRLEYRHANEWNNSPSEYKYGGYKGPRLTPRCADLPELYQVQMDFSKKYGKEFVAATTELMPEHGVSRQQRLLLLGKKVEAILKSAWTEKDQIDNFLKERRLMRSLESSLVGDYTKETYGCDKRTI